MKTQHLTHGGGRSAALPHQDRSGTGAHEMEGGGVGGDPANDDGHVELVDESFEIEGLSGAGDVLGGDHRAADDEKVGTGLDGSAPVPLGLGGAEPPGDDDAGLTDLRQTGCDEFGAHRDPVDLLQHTGGLLGHGPPNAFQSLGGVVVARPQTLEVEHADTAQTTDEDSSGGAHHRVHG